MHFKHKPFPSILITLALLAGLANIGLAAAGDTIRVSVDTGNVQRSRASYTASISAEGRYIAFLSFHSITGNTVRDVLVHDRQTGITSLVSKSSTGVVGNGISNNPSISADGRYIAFESESDNLVAGDTNGRSDIFVHDVQTGTTIRVSVDSNGIQGNGDSENPSISANGRFVAFDSWSTNLVNNISNFAYDVFVHDLQNHTTTRISLATDGTEGNNSSGVPSISADGHFVSFQSIATSLVSNDTNGVFDIFLRDTQKNITTRLSVHSNGIQGDFISWSSSINDDGHFVAFYSYAKNLVDGDTNGVPDVFVHDTRVGTTTRVSVNPNNVQGNAHSYAPSISSDGRYIAFHSQATNLVPGDTGTLMDIFVRDMQTNKITRASVDSNGIQGNHPSYNPSISADGRFVAFESHSDNLVSGDTNDVDDVFVHELDWPIIEEPTTLPTTGFPMTQVTKLPLQPASKAYTSTDLFLEIPALNQKILIVSVPQTSDGWDVTWLGNSASWLNGSAFPTWAGNTVLTGHVWDAYNQPGPFAQLKTLKFGDEIKIHAWGQVYTYEVRESKLVTSWNVEAALQHEEYDWVTLLSCEYYNPLPGNYLFRRMVRAVLVSVK